VPGLHPSRHSVWPRLSVVYAACEVPQNHQTIATWLICNLHSNCYTAFISGLNRYQPIVQATCLVCTVHGIQFDRVYQRCKPRARAQTILTSLVFTLHSNCLIVFISGIRRVEVSKNRSSYVPLQVDRIYQRYNARARSQTIVKQSQCTWSATYIQTVWPRLSAV